MLLPGRLGLVRDTPGLTNRYSGPTAGVETSSVLADDVVPRVTQHWGRRFGVPVPCTDWLPAPTSERRPALVAELLGIGLASVQAVRRTGARRTAGAASSP